MKIPNADRAVVDPAKVRDYLLSVDHPVGWTKATFFGALGFRRDDWPVLQAALLAHALGDAEEMEEIHGQKYVVRDILKGVGGRSAVVISVWMILVGEELPKLITAYPARRS